MLGEQGKKKTGMGISLNGFRYDEKYKEQQRQQQSQEEQDAVYTQKLQEFEGTQAAVRSSISKASTILDEENWLALIEDNFVIIQWKMDRIYQKIELFV